MGPEFKSLFLFDISEYVNENEIHDPRNKTLITATESVSGLYPSSFWQRWWFRGLPLYTTKRVNIQTEKHYDRTAYIIYFHGFYLTLVLYQYWTY